MSNFTSKGSRHIMTSKPHGMIKVRLWGGHRDGQELMIPEYVQVLEVEETTEGDTESMWARDDRYELGHKGVPVTRYRPEFGPDNMVARSKRDGAVAYILETVRL